jgi:hypothetical protein
VEANFHRLRAVTHDGQNNGLVITPNQGAHFVSPCEQEFGEVAADAAHSARCSGHEDRVVVFMFRPLQRPSAAGRALPFLLPVSGHKLCNTRKAEMPAPGRRASVGNQPATCLALLRALRQIVDPHILDRYAVGVTPMTRRKEWLNVDKSPNP